MAVGTFVVSWSIYVDPVTRIMLIVITSVSALVHIYSIGYMSHDNSKPRFMAYLSLFTFTMLALVTADNFFNFFLDGKVLD
jgi:NADH-quinone oxidoreductase subunit L